MENESRNWRIIPRENWYRDIILFVISGILLWSTIVGQNTANQSRQTANEAASLARVNSRISVDIQKERYNTVFNLCWDQNNRHDKTIASLKQQIKYFQKHPINGVSKLQARVSAKGSIVLVNDLAPRQNCANLAAESTR